ncbi:hypothetical protein MTO96_043219 [Rhipicephalus appendiculatus]
MVDMPTRNSRLGSIRQASSSLYVQVRGHGFLCAVALTGFTVALLSLLDTVEAKANERTLPRSGVEGEPEVLRQRQLAKGALSYPIYYPELGDFEIARQTKVQCDPLIYSNVSRCETTAEGDNDVEYCYENDKVNATEAIKRCSEHSSMLVDTQKIDLQAKRNLFELFRFKQESWVDLKKEDLSELSGVFSANFTEIDWALSCTTVWLNYDVPWFFVRNCSDFYPVLCEASNASKDELVITYLYKYMRDCGDSNWVYCVSQFRKFNKTTGSEYCANYTFSLLSGKVLRTLFFVGVGLL